MFDIIILILIIIIHIMIINKIIKIIHPTILLLLIIIFPPSFSLLGTDDTQMYLELSCLSNCVFEKVIICSMSDRVFTLRVLGLYCVVRPDCVFEKVLR